MRSVWIVGLSLSMGTLASGVCAEEYHWQPARSAVSAGLESPPAAQLGRPVPSSPATSGIIAEAPVPDGLAAIRTSSRVAELGAPQILVVRAQNPEYTGPSLAPPVGSPRLPASPDERYNCGVVNDPPGGKPGHHWFGNCGERIRNLFSGAGAGIGAGLSGGGRSLFQSDHCFDNFISPVSSPFLSEDPRALTEVRPIFIQQGAPSSQYVFRGGNIEYLGVQARLAFTDWFSVVVNKFGDDFIEPNTTMMGFGNHSGFSELWLGPKITFYRCESTGTVAAAGLTFQVPTGPSRVYQDTGSLSLSPYASVAQNFGRTSYGSFNVMDTTGYSFSTDNKRSEYLYSNFHLDYDILDAHKFYPLLELNWTHYTQAGTAHAFGFEGNDLFNFGSTAVSGHDDLSLALGARYKFCEAIQVGGAAEVPLNGASQLLDYRVTFDLIFRY